MYLDIRIVFEYVLGYSNSIRILGYSNSIRILKYSNSIRILGYSNYIWQIIEQLKYSNIRTPKNSADSPSPKINPVSFFRLHAVSKK